MGSVCGSRKAAMAEVKVRSLGLPRSTWKIFPRLTVWCGGIKSKLTIPAFKEFLVTRRGRHTNGSFQWHPTRSIRASYHSLVSICPVQGIEQHDGDSELPSAWTLLLRMLWGHRGGFLSRLEISWKLCGRGNRQKGTGRELHAEEITWLNAQWYATFEPRLRRAWSCVDCCLQHGDFQIYQTKSPPVCQWFVV